MLEATHSLWWPSMVKRKKSNKWALPTGTFTIFSSDLRAYQRPAFWFRGSETEVPGHLAACIRSVWLAISLISFIDSVQALTRSCRSTNSFCTLSMETSDYGECRRGHPVARDVLTSCHPVRCCCSYSCTNWTVRCLRRFECGLCEEIL